MDFNFRTSPELQQYIRANVKRTGKKLGRGAFGTVEQVTMCGATCAAKTLHGELVDSHNFERQKLIEDFKRECKIMAMLRHPNIVQFLGVCFFDESPYPVILMECLETSLHDFLTKQGKDSLLTLSSKMSILRDIASGMTYLHWHNPPIVHRDLTAKNVLLARHTLQVKIADLGNSRAIKLGTSASSLTRAPGTIVYMPPEAFGDSLLYDSKLDIFSFGHLSLFVLLQEFPGNLLQAKSMRRGKLIPRSEVSRRSEYFKDMKSLLGARHPTIKLIESCLHDDPRNRPSAKQVFQEIEKQQEAISPTKEPRDSHSETGAREWYPRHILERKTTLIRNGTPNLLELATRRRGEVVWKQFMFQIANSTHLQYFKDITKRDKVTGEIKLSQVTRVSRMIGLRFEITFSGRGSPWALKASNEEDRICWMEAIMPESSQFQQWDAEYGREKQVPQQEYYVKMQPHATQAAHEYDIPACVSAHLDAERGHKCSAIHPTPQLEYYKSLGENRAPSPVYDQPDMQDPPVYDDIRPPQQPEGKGYAAGLPPNEYAELLRGNFSQDQLAQLLEMFQKLQATGSDVEEPSPRYRNVQEARSCFGSGEKRDGIPQINIQTPKPVPRKYQREQRNLLAPDPEPFRRSKKGRKYSPMPSPHHSPHPSPLPSPRHSPYPSPLPSPTTSPQHSSRQQKATPVLQGLSQVSVASLISNCESLSRDMLVTDEDNYEPRPEWAKARTDAGELVADKAIDLGFQVPNVKEADLKDMTMIGKGEFGFVYKATLGSRGNNVVAVKTIKRYESQKETRDFMREMATMSQVMHPNIIQLFGFVEQKYWLVLEYMAKGDLKQFLTKHKRPVHVLVKYMIDVAMGMHYLSEKGLIHRDLAARNVMVSQNELCKVADFGLVRQLPDDNEYYFSSATPSRQPVRWMAPESLSERKYSTASDVWSFGILQWEMFHPTKPPYEGMDSMQCVVRISDGYRLPIPPDCPKPVADIMIACWQRKAAHRPSFLLISMLLTNANLHAS